MNIHEYATSALIGNGYTICGIPPARRLVTWSKEPCWNCQGRVLRRFSGSGWYYDDFMCLDCGEDVGSGYRPFRRAWRKQNIARAQEWESDVIERDEFFELTGRVIRDEMGWDDPEANTPQYQEGGSATTDPRLVALPDQYTTKER